MTIIIIVFGNHEYYDDIGDNESNDVSEYVIQVEDYTSDVISGDAYDDVSYNKCYDVKNVSDEAVLM